MKVINHETKNPFASFLTGVALAVVLGSMVALSTSAFAMGGGGGGGGPAPAPAPAPVPEITKVDDPVANPRDEVAEVKKPVVEPDDKTPVGELKTKEPEEKTLAIEDPDEDKTENKPDKRTTEFPGQVIEAVVGFAASTSSVVEEGGLSEIQVRISKPLPQQVVLGVSAVGTAIEDVDYKISSASLTIPAGATSGTITLISLDDDVDEVDEAVTLTLTGVPVLPVGVTFGTTAHTVTIVDDDIAEVEETPEVVVTPGDETDRETEDKTVNKPDERGVEFPRPEVPKVVEASVGFAASTSSLAENGGRLRLEVRSGVLSQPVTLDVVVGGTAKRRIDYTISSTSLTIPADAASAFLTLTGVNDAIYETDETITLVLKGNLPDGMKFGTDTHTVTIVDDEIAEATVGFERLTTQVEEGGNASLRVALSRPFPQPVTARLSMGGDTDAFELSPSTVTFQPGETSKIVVLRAVEDSDGADERVTLYLGGNFPDGVRYGEIHGHIVTIADNDVSGTVGFASVANPATASEGDTVRLTVASSVAPAAGSPISLDWSVSPAEEVDNAAGTVTITSPASTGTFEINIVNDDVAETEERITVTLSDRNLHDLFTIGGSATHVIAIPANDQIAEVVEATVGFMPPFSQVAKGATGNLQIVLSNPLPQPLTLTLSEVSSEDGEDKIISFSSDVLTFQPGETSKDVSFTARDTGNGYESAIVFLEGDLPEGVTLGAHNFHFITILDTGNRLTAEDNTEVEEKFESTIGFATTSSTIQEADAVEIQVQITKPLPQPVTLDVAVTGTSTTAITGADYYTIPSTLTIPAGTTSTSLTLTSIDDAMDEEDETITLILSGELLPAGIVLGATTHTVTIVDNDVAELEEAPEVAIDPPAVKPPAIRLPVVEVNDEDGDETDTETEDKTVNKPDERGVEFPKPEVPKVVEASVGFAASTSSLDESGGRLRLEVRSGVLSQPVTLDVVVGGTAEQGMDYTISSTSLTIPADAASAFLTLTGVDDAIYETDETITLALKGSLPAGMKFGTDTHTVTIVDDEIEVVEATVGFERWTTQMEEGGNASLRVSLSRSFPHPVTARVSMEGDTDALEFSPGTVTFQPGETSKIVFLRAVEDSDGANERVTLYLGGNFPDGVWHGEIHGHTVTIADNDVTEDETVNAVDEPPPGFVRAVAGFATRRSEVNEGGSVELQVELSKPLPKTVTLDVMYPAAWTSVSLDDIDSLPSTVTFPQGETTASVSFTVVDDSIDESDEEIRIRLMSRDESLPYVRVRLARRQHTVTIIDNDSAVEVGFGSSYSEVDEGDNLSLPVVLSGPLPQPLTLSVTGSTGSGDDIVLPDSLTIEQGETRKSFVVAIVDDAIPEANKMVTLSLEGELPDGVKFSSRTHDIGIIDNDSDVEVGFVRSRSRANEGDSLFMQVRLNRSLPQPLTLSVVGSAGSGDDIILPDSLTIEQRQRVKSFVVAIVDDAVFEGAETFTLSLEGELPDGVKFSDHTHVFTIIDNDTVNATVGFAESSSEVVEGESLSVQIELSHAFLQSITLLVNENFYYDDIHVPGTLTFEPGETSKALEISTVDNYVFDEDRTFRLLLRENWSNRFPDGVRFGTREHVITMTDDNDDMIVGFASSSTDVGEDVGSVAVEVVLGRPLLQPLTISFSDSASAASNAPDADIRERTVDVYRPSRSLTFEPGETSKLFLFDFADDRVGESTEYYTMTLEGDLPDGMKFGRRTHTIYTHDNDRPDEGTEDIHINEFEGGEISVINEEQVGRIETVHYHVPDQNSTITIENLGIVDTDVVARIFDFQNSGRISIKNATQGTVGGNVIGKQHGNGKISVENRGTVDGDIRAVQFRDGVTEIVNHGNVGENIEVTHYGDSKISIENRGTVDRMEAVHYGDSEILITNYETATATAIAANHYGSGEISIANHGTAEVNARHEDDNGVVRFAGNINGGSSNELTGGAIHLGVVDFKRSTGEGVSTLEIYGDYEGLSDTRLNFHVGPDGLDYGRLWIDGDVTGQSRVSLIVDGEVAADTGFDLWDLIEVDGEAQANSFYGAETVGAFDYVLEYEREGSRDHAWHFVNRGLSEVASQSSQTVDEIIKNMITPTAANPGERDEYWCLWGEQLGSHTVLGFEVPVTRLAGGDMFVGTSVARNSSTSSNISVESQITALAASWERGGLYVGGQTRLARFISDVSTGRLSVVQNNGGTGISTSVETGYWFDVMNFRISPQVQLTWTRVGFDDFVGPHGELVSLEDGDRVTGQLGLSWDGEWQGAEGFGRLYGGMNLRSNLDGKTSVNVSGVSVASEQDDLSIDGKLGFSYEWNEGYAVRGEVSALRSDDAEEVRANLGVRIDF